MSLAQRMREFRELDPSIDEGTTSPGQDHDEPIGPALPPDLSAFDDPVFDAQDRRVVRILAGDEEFASPDPVGLAEDVLDVNPNLSPGLVADIFASLDRSVRAGQTPQGDAIDVAERAVSGQQETTRILPVSIPNAGMGLGALAVIGVAIVALIGLILRGGD